MIYCESPVDAELIRKVNRFLCLVKIEGETHRAHIPNSGRLTELMTPGRRVVVSRSTNPERKTPYTLHAVWMNGRWICVNSTVPNRLAYEMAVSKSLPIFSGYRNIRREYSLGAHRFDLSLSGEDLAPMIVEVKSVTLVKDRVAMFPDAPTERGRAHLDALSKLAAQGYRCAALFVVQRSDADIFLPNADNDPAFAQKLVMAADAGVDVLAIRCRVGRSVIQPLGAIPVRPG